MYKYSLIRLLLATLCLLLGACGMFSVSPVDSTQPTVEIAPENEMICECPSPLIAEMCDVVPEAQTCPQQVTKIITTPIKTIDDRLLIGRVENVYLPDKLKFKARIDTGAGLSSIHALDVTEFERDGKGWVRFAVPKRGGEKIYFEQPVKRYINIKQLSGEPQRRPIVIMSIVLGSLEEQIEVTLSDRTGYLYEVLIGRNFLRDRAVVDVSKKFTAPLPAN